MGGLPLSDADGPGESTDPVDPVAEATRSAQPTATAASPVEAKRNALGRGDSVGRYVVLAQIGEGGMGQVYSAYDPELDRKVAIKVLRSGFGSDSADLRTRMLREAQALARLSHPNVVSVFDVGWLPDGRMALTMELVTGTTLRAWQKEKPRGWREVVDVYLAAGRGLSAAHGAGLVHRDFKPANVLLGGDGSVKVTDFGLARALHTQNSEAERASIPPEESLERLQPKLANLPTGQSDDSQPSARSSSTALDSALTQTGVLLGTPGYMAPEQFLGLPVDERSDQFAFCVSFFEGLYGVRPFSGRGVEGIYKAVMVGRVADVPDRKVPQWVRRAVLRGLSAEPADRFPSMQELLNALSRDRRVIGMRAAAVVSGVAVLSAVAMGVRSAKTHEAAICSGAPAEMAEVWNDGARTGIERAFMATGAAFAADTWKRSRDALDAYAERWTAAHRQACEATQLRREQSEATMTARITCLEERRDQMRALTRVFAEADRSTVEKALEAIGGLPSEADCADLASLANVQPLPNDAARRADIEAIRRDLASASAYAAAGKYAPSLELVEPLVARAKASAYAPVLAHALLVRGLAQARSGLHAEAIASLREASVAAERGRADDTKTRAMAALVVELGDSRRPEDAYYVADMATAALERLSGKELYAAEIAGGRGRMLYFEMKYDQAAAEYRRAIAIAEHAGKSDLTLLAKLYRGAAAVAADTNHLEDAISLLDRADALLVRDQGPDHPTRVAVWNSKSATYGNEERWAESLVAIDTGLSIASRALPPESAGAADLHANRAWVLQQLGRPDEALVEARLAGDLVRRAYGKANPVGDFARTMQAEALVRLGRVPEALVVARETAASADSLLPSDHEWLAYAHHVYGQAKLAGGDATGAVAELERAVAIYKNNKDLMRGDKRDQARATSLLASALWNSGVDKARVLRVSAEAEAEFRALGDERAARVVNEWAVAAVGKNVRRRLDVP